MTFMVITDYDVNIIIMNKNNNTKSSHISTTVAMMIKSVNCKFYPHHLKNVITIITIIAILPLSLLMPFFIIDGSEFNLLTLMHILVLRRYPNKLRFSASKVVLILPEDAFIKCFPSLRSYLYQTFTSMRNTHEI